MKLEMSESMNYLFEPAAMCPPVEVRYVEVSPELFERLFGGK